MKKRFNGLLFVLIYCTATLYGESAYQQLLNQGGSAPNVPMPKTPSGNYNKYTPSSSQQSSQSKSIPSKSYHAPSTSAMVGGALFGALLESVLFAPPPSNQPDPETLRLQAEQQRKAQEEAARKAKEAQIHHKKLMGSFKATASTSSTTEASSSGLAFKTAKSTEATQIDTSSDEALRESASRPFDGGATHDNFANQFNPTYLSKVPITLSKPVLVCKKGKCAWPSKTTTITTALPKAQTRTKTTNLSTLGTPTAPNPKEFISLLLGNTPSNNTKHYLFLKRLDYLASETKELGKELLISIGMSILESTPMGRKFSLTKEVHDLAVTNMQDSIKVARWLGSTQLDEPPEITSISEASKPFLLKAIGTSKSFEEVAELITDASEIFGLSEKLFTLYKGMP